MSIEQMYGHKPPIRFNQQRPGDQRYYVSDIRRFQELTEWQPQIPVRQGVEKLYHWLLESRRIPFIQLLPAAEVVT
jgi:CDP-paratose 2-epimerase